MILDGWGHSETTASNAIKAAQTPVWDTLWENSPHTLLNASEESAGLPRGQMGNSEVGHMIMGAGRIIAQNSTRIDGAIADGSFFKNPILCSAIDRANAAGGDVHIQGLLSDGGVHSHEHQIHAMVELAKYKESPLILVCKMGQHSGAANKTLTEDGFVNVKRMDGGMGEWSSANMPVVKGKSKGKGKGKS